jgi:outer membrane lipoprotein
VNSRYKWTMLPALFSALILISSCSIVSKSVREQVDTSAPFETMRRDPGGYTGRTVLLGGYILEVRNLPEKTRIVVLQTPLGSQDRPEPRDQSEGRFVIVADGFLDPAVYSTDLGITVAGTVMGEEVVQIDQVSYPTLAVKPMEMHLWQKETRAYYPWPYYGPYPYDPFFYDPFSPWPRPYYFYNPPVRQRRK